MFDPLLDQVGPIGPNGASESDAAEELLAECLALPEGQRARAIEDACASRPQLAGELRTRVAALHAMGIELCPDRGFPEQLGDFRLIRVLGGGGMGVVYLAVQTSLRRDVALKLIRPEHLYFAGARARFRREAEAVARLQHPGIVPIYAIGEDQGIPYFAMELVRGCTLAEALLALRGRAPESLSGADLRAPVAAAAGVREPLQEENERQEGSIYAGTWVETCLRIARQVADALQHAHERGLIHRDVKPSNIALTPDGRTLLLDFGLTRAEHGAEHERGATRTGTALGTLNYMSPEQVRGAHDIDARSDVYSLGVTLYEALALQLPYRGKDELEVRRLVLEGGPDPIRPRNRRVEADVETVVLSALDRDPARRYATAADFARDLGHLLAHRPIEARRPGAMLRARRWLQRHPALGTAVVLGPSLVLAAAVTFFVREKAHSHELKLELEETQLARDAARRASARATSEAESAKAALDFVVGMFSPKSLPRGSGEIATLPQAFAHGESAIEAELRGDPVARARMFTVLGLVFERQGAHEKALALFEKARELWRGQDVRTVGPYVAATLTAMGETLSVLGRVPEACACFREALPLWPEGPEWATDREEAFGSLGRLDVSQGADDRLETVALMALDKELARSAPDPIAVARCRADLGLALLRKRNFDKAAVELQSAFDTLIQPESPPTRDSVVLINNLAEARCRQGQFEVAAALSDRGLALARQIYPEQSEMIGIMLYNRADIDEDRDELESALQGFRAATSIFRNALTPDHPEMLAASSRFADLASRLGRFEEAEGVACEVLATDVESANDPDGSESGERGRALVVLARGAEARAHPEQARDLWRAAICLLHCDRHFAREEAFARADLARICLDEGSTAEAEMLFESALDITREQEAGIPRAVLDGLVRVCRAAGRSAEADSYAARMKE